MLTQPLRMRVCSQALVSYICASAWRYANARASSVAGDAKKPRQFTNVAPGAPASSQVGVSGASLRRWGGADAEQANPALLNHIDDFAIP